VRGSAGRIESIRAETFKGMRHVRAQRRKGAASVKTTNWFVNFAGRDG